MLYLHSMCYADPDTLDIFQAFVEGQDMWLGFGDVLWICFSFPMATLSFDRYMRV